MTARFNVDRPMRKDRYQRGLPAIATVIVLTSVLACAVTDAYASQPEDAAVVPLRDGVGTPALNRTERDALGNVATERRYHRDSVARGTTIAEVAVGGDAGVRAEEAARFELVIRGHLEELDLPRAPADSAVLWVDVIGPAGTTTQAVRVRDLMRRKPIERFEQYQVVSVPVRSENVTTIRVRFAGNATVGVGAIHIRRAPSTAIDPH